jgi:CRISPR/Cas system-associated exonuclease Cas4 (RecB family)
MDIEHISVSRKQLWDKCQQAYKFRYHLRVPEEEEKPYLIFGKVIHKISEVYCQNQGKTPIESIATDVIKGSIPLEENALPPILEKEYLKKLPVHVKNIKTINDKIGYDGHFEWKFHYDLNPPNKQYITGFIDRLIERNGKYFILDFKTTKKGFWRKNANTVKKDLQLRCYARVVQKEFGVKAENINTALYYVSDGQIVSSRFSEESLIDAEKELHFVYEQIQNMEPDDVHGRLGYHCKQCAYTKICPLYSLT